MTDKPKKPKRKIIPKKTAMRSNPLQNGEATLRKFPSDTVKN